VTARDARIVAMRHVSGDTGLVEASVAPGAPVPGQVPFELTLRNIGTGAVTITNPYEGASYHLINGAGSPVQVNEPPSRAKVHVARDPADRLAYLDLTEARVDGKPVESHEFIGAESLELPASGEMVLSLAVTASLDTSDLTRLDHVPAGDYQLVVILRVVVTAGGKRHPILLRTDRELPVAAT
jgi:hypothetical protein